jgi:hypothetical protein
MREWLGYLWCWLRCRHAYGPWRHIEDAPHFMYRTCRRCGWSHIFSQRLYDRMK